LKNPSLKKNTILAQEVSIMSVSYIPERVKIRLWGQSGGRCAYEGCNKPLWKDDLTQAEFNVSYIAHIYGDSEGGPRWHEVHSDALKADISNLMLMCDVHHRLIDREQVAEHPVERLQEMKRKHEKRIESLTEFQPEARSHVIRFGANVGKQNAVITFNESFAALLPHRYPTDKPGIELGLVNSSFKDDIPNYWMIERENLRNLYAEKIRPLRERHEVQHYSIFGIAPQPLLIELGRLFSDIPQVEVYQKHREPTTWDWQDSPGDLVYLVEEPEEVHPTVALNVSLSATVVNDRIHQVLGEDVSIWTLTLEKPYEPNNDYLQSRGQLTAFRQKFRKMMDDIKARHGEKAVIHVFPCAPVAVAVEIGRCWMPKADLALRLYDENKKLGGFVHTFDIERE